MQQVTPSDAPSTPGDPVSSFGPPKSRRRHAPHAPDLLEPIVPSEHADVDEPRDRPGTPAPSRSWRTCEPPSLPERVVPRPRVTDAIAERVARHALVQVVAPAGSGKTTAVVQSLDRSDRAVTWLTIEQWHRSAGKLLEGVLGALEHVAPGLTSQVVSARAEDVDAVELAALMGAFMRRRHALLVIDDCHLVRESPEAISVLSALVRNGVPGLHVVLLGRTPLPLVGLGTETLVPDATVGEGVLRANREEAEAILREHESALEPDEAVRVTGGWIAGLLFEAWGSVEGAPPSQDPLPGFFEREVQPHLAPHELDLLDAASIFDVITASRIEALGARDPRGWLDTLRRAGIPAVWAPDGFELRLHPRIREYLAERLAGGPAEHRLSALRAATAVYEREGDLEHALDLAIETGDGPAARRLLPEVILEVVERRDFALAERYLTAAQFDPEPAKVVLARLVLASLKASMAEMLAVVEPLWESGRLTALVVEKPEIGTFVSNVMAARSVEEAVEVLDAIPPGRASDVARLMLSIVRDDPDAPIPPFTGDVLDAVLARALYCRGLLRELRAANTSWAESTGAAGLGGNDTSPQQTSPSTFIRELERFHHAVAARDLQAARMSTSNLSATGGAFYLLAEAELGVRLERNAQRVRGVIDELRNRHLAAIPFYREQVDTWDGGSLLLADDAEGAADVLRAATARMRHGDRILMLPTALVYLAEAEWRLGNEEAADRAADEAYEIARRQETLRGLLLSLADFPGVLSRRLDAEKGIDSRWHSLGRALVGGSARGKGVIVGSSVAHLRDFGESVLVVTGEEVRPKIRKSLELLSYLLLSPTRQVSRQDILTALWNGRDDDSTRAYLRQALRHLRDVLPDGIAVTAVGDALSIEGAVTSESLELEAVLAEAAREAGPRRLGYLLDALELAGRGLFLEGSRDVRWVDDHRSRIQSVLADARLDAAELLLRSDRHLRALALVDEALDADPLLERAWRLRMRTLDLIGDHDGVIAAYAGCARALAEIGLTPSGQTRELAQALRR